MSEPKRTKSYRGVELDAELAALIRHMPAVDATRESLQALQGVWDSLALLSELSGTGVEIAGIRAAFASLTSRLVDEIGQQARHKAALEQLAKAQVTVDILVRNLFERTADIGFLATDDDLRAFAAADAPQRAELLPALRRRLREYQRKYSVYDDIILLAPDGTVLARLDDEVEVARTRDRALLDAALQGQAAYVEVYRPFDLRPGSACSLVYASRVTDAAGQRPLGVLCLSFRFEDECRRIFRKFVGVNDWSVVALLDADGAVIASSDAFQVPLSAQVAVPDDGRAHVLRFAGRHWLAVSCAAHAFQGYAGPGWRGHAMTPIEHAFAADDEDAERLDPDTAARLRCSRVLYPDSLRAIAAAAQRIESDLARAVWNGNLALIAASAGADAAGNAGFSRSLLREIGRTGARTRDSFTLALDQVSASVASATLAGARSRAALAADIMDRSLYERANDCRWWALTTQFRASLEAAEAPDGAALERVLRTIHGLYTVYASLVLYDRQGRVVAASSPSVALSPGAALDGEWVARSLALSDTQAYCVSAFEPTPLYGGRPTYIYAAAVRGLADASRVVGGIAIVFDAEPQFRSMLQDTLPRDEGGQPLPGAFGAFVDGTGRVVACSHAEPAIGSLLDASGELRAAAARGSRAFRWDERWTIAGAARSSGYREFKGPDDAYREEVTALVFEAMTDRGEADEAPVAVPAPPAAGAARGGGERVDLATLRIGDQWHALTGRDLVEAVPADRLLPLPGSAPHVRGSVMYRNAPIAVIEADRLLGVGGSTTPARQRQIVVLQPPRAQGRPFGLLVDALGDNPEVHSSQLVRLAEGRWQRGPGGAALIDTVVAPAPGSAGNGLLTLLSADALAGLLAA
ncbi:MAG: chemotaxis protein CheW [Piscinibacter sp.]|nr:chemotaxis protein CheW [Piscinibacter sp.]